MRQAPCEPCLNARFSCRPVVAIATADAQHSGVRAVRLHSVAQSESWEGLHSQHPNANGLVRSPSKDDVDVANSFGICWAAYFGPSL